MGERMNRLARWMMRLYPARWRERYGDELDVLITDSGADVRTVADLARGGIRMQFSTWSFPKLALVLGIAGVVMGAAVSFIAKPMYESTVTLAMQGTPEQLHELVGWAEPVVLSRSELSSIINDPRLLLYKEQLKVRPLDDVIEGMHNNVHIAAGPGQTIEISFRYPDAVKAQLATASLADKFRRTSDNERTTRASETPRPLLDVVDTANLPFAAPLQKAIQWGFVLPAISIPFLWRKIFGKRMLSRWLLLSIPICAVIGGIAGDLVAAYQRTGRIHVPGYRYRSTAMMQFTGTTEKQKQDLIDGALTRTSLSTIINDPRLLLYSDELKKTPLEDVVQEMKRRTTIAPVPDHPDYFTVSFEYKDRFRAQQTVEAMMSHMYDSWKQNGSATTIVPLGNWGPVSIQSPASPPQPIAGDPYQYAGTGGLIGVILAALIAMIRRRWTPESAITQ